MENIKALFLTIYFLRYTLGLSVIIASGGYAKAANCWMTDHISLIKTKEVIFLSGLLILTVIHIAVINKQASHKGQ